MLDQRQKAVVNNKEHVKNAKDALMDQMVIQVNVIIHFHVIQVESKVAKDHK